MPTIFAVAHTGRRLARFGLAGCVLSAGLLGAAVTPRASEAASAHATASAPSAQDGGKVNAATAPISDAPMPESARSTGGIGFGWG